MIEINETRVDTTETIAIDMDELKMRLTFLACGEHMGDINNDLVPLARLFGLPIPEWDERKQRLVFEWETDEWWGEL